MIPELLFAVLALAAAVAAPRVLTLRDPLRRRRERALGMAGRLALPAPDDEQCRMRRALLDATGRADPTGIPDCGDGDGAYWDPVRVGTVRHRDGAFTPWRPLPTTARTRAIPMPPPPDDRRD